MLDSRVPISFDGDALQKWNEDGGCRVAENENSDRVQILVEESTGKDTTV